MVVRFRPKADPVQSSAQVDPPAPITEYLHQDELVPPWEEAPKPAAETMLEALHKFAKGDTPPLMLVHKEKGTTFEVIGFDPSTSKATVKQTNYKAILTPTMREKDNQWYEPLWRD